MTQNKIEIPRWMRDMPPLALKALKDGLTNKFQSLSIPGNHLVANEIIILLASIVELEKSRNENDT